MTYNDDEGSFVPPLPSTHPFDMRMVPPLPDMDAPPLPDTEAPPLPPSHGYEDAPPLPPSMEPVNDQITGGEEDRGRKRKSKWGDPSKRILIGGIHAPLPASMNATQLLLYLVQSRMEEIDRKLRSGDVIPLERDRSPSPPPTYDGQGKRTNTRDLRYKKKLEDEGA